MQRFDDPTDNQMFGAPVAQSSAMSMELRSSPTESVRYASTRSMWRYTDGGDSGLQAGVRSDNFEWQHGDARVKVRYLQHDNVFQSAVGSNVFELAGDTTLVQTRRNDIGVSLRVRQENVRTTMTDTLRTADVDANGRLELVPSFIVHYGMSSRLAFDRTECAPSTGAEWKITKNTVLIGSGAYKVLDSSTAARLVPSLVAWSDDGRVLPRYIYSFGLVSNRDASNRVDQWVTPNFFNDEQVMPAGVPEYDAMGLVQQPLTILPGGYQSLFVVDFYASPDMPSYTGWLSVTNFRHAGRDAAGFLDDTGGKVLAR
jgi:hypothetical protein